MSIFFIDQREFKASARKVIDSGTNLEEQLRALIDEHGIQINKDTFIFNILRLCISCNSNRAKKLVGALGDRDLRNCWQVSIVGLLVLARLSVLLGIVWAGIAIYHCGDAP